MRILAGDIPISSLAEWLTYAPPAGNDAQWEDGRSAKELAKAWLSSGRPDVPADIAALFDSHQAFRGLEIHTATPEEQIRFDRYRGGVRNADLTLRGVCGSSKVIVSIEAKADEALGGTVAKARAAAKARRKKNLASNADRRVDGLIAAVLGLGPTEPTKSPYQALTATAGLQALAASEGADLLLLLFHEFVNGTRSDGLRATSPTKVHRNAAGLDSFILELSRGEQVRIHSPTILGPFTPPGGPNWPGRPFYVGKLTTDLAQVRG